MSGFAMGGFSWKGKTILVTGGAVFGKKFETGPVSDNEQGRTAFAVRPCVVWRAWRSEYVRGYRCSVR